MDLGDLVLIAAAVLDVDSIEVVDRADLEAVSARSDAFPAKAPVLEQAAALLHAASSARRPFR